MRNKELLGDVITIAATEEVKSGAPVLIGNLFGVANTDAKEGELFAISLKGGYALPKNKTQVFNIGDLVYFDKTSGNCGAPVAGKHLIGVCLSKSGNGAEEVTVLLNGISTTIFA